MWGWGWGFVFFYFGRPREGGESASVRRIDGYTTNIASGGLQDKPTDRTSKLSPQPWSVRLGCYWGQFPALRSINYPINLKAKPDHYQYCLLVAFSTRCTFSRWSIFGPLLIHLAFFIVSSLVYTLSYLTIHGYENVARHTLRLSNMTWNSRWWSRCPRYKAAVHVPDFDTLVPAPELSLADAKNYPFRNMATQFYPGRQIWSGNQSVEIRYVNGS